MHFYTNVQQYGNRILLREIDGKARRNFKVEYRPSLFVKSNKKTDSKYKTLNGEVVEKMKFGSINDAKDFCSNYSDVMEIYGNSQYIYPFISDTYKGDIEYDISSLNIINLDIEVECENGFPEPEYAEERVTAITIKRGLDYVVFGLGDWDKSKSVMPDHGLNLQYVQYHKCKDEYNLLSMFMKYWTSNYPDIVTGWNVNQFDCSYLVNRITKVLGEPEMKKLSPWGLVRKINKNIRGQDQQHVAIVGLSIIDYLDLYRKFTYVTRESYRLDHIAYVELGERKLDHSEHDNLHMLYQSDYQKYIDYNIKDVLLVDRLDDKLKLLELLITIAYQSKVNFDEVFSPIKVWDSIAFNELKKDNIVIPPKSMNEKDTAYAGGYVKDPVVGKHSWVMSFDLNSLYPHLIMQYNISPETLYSGSRIDLSVDSLLDKSVDLSSLKDQDLTVCPSGVLFTKDKRGFLPKLMEKMYNDRVKYKKEMLRTKQLKIDGSGDVKELDKKISQLDNKQMAAKILLNSAYGALGNQYFRYFDIRQAESITLAGQLSIRWIDGKVNKYLNKILQNEEPKDYVIASDTDSIYVSLDDLVSKVMKRKDGESEKDFTTRIVDFLDKIAAEKFEPYIDKSYQELADYVNAYDQKMFMKREVIADSGIWTAKKRYILNVHDSEGVRYKEPSLKIMGIEAVRSSTPEACRNKIKECLLLILRSNNDKLIDFIEEFRRDYKKYSIDVISFPRGINGLEKYSDRTTVFKKGTPIHVKGALFYNKLLSDMKLTRKYQLIKEGEKIKFCYLKEPNPIQNNTIAITSVLPEEFNLNSYIDYDTQFEKSFLEPIKTITDIIGWDLERKITLDSFFN